MHSPFPSSTGPLSIVKKEHIIYNAVEMVFQVGAFSDEAVFGRACPILIRFNFTWVIFSPRDDYHTGFYSHWTLILFELLPGNYIWIPDSTEIGRRRCCGFEFSSEALNARLHNRPIKALNAFLQNLSSIVFFDDASSYIPLSEPNKSKSELFVLISTDYRPEKCTVYTYSNTHIVPKLTQNRLKHLFLQRNRIMSERKDIMNIIMFGRNDMPSLQYINTMNQVQLIISWNWK